MSSQVIKWKEEEIFRSPTTLAAFESLEIPLVQEVVFMADFRSPRCQQRVAEIMTKMNGETQSVVISVVEKTVTLTTSTYPNVERRIIASLFHNSYWI